MQLQVITSRCQRSLTILTKAPNLGICCEETNKCGRRFMNLVAMKHVLEMNRKNL